MNIFLVIVAIIMAVMLFLCMCNIMLLSSRIDEIISILSNTTEIQKHMFQNQGAIAKCVINMAKIVTKIKVK